MKKKNRTNKLTGGSVYFLDFCIYFRIDFNAVQKFKNVFSLTYILEN